MDITTTGLITLAVAALDISAIILAISRSGGVERTLAWLAAIVAFPGVGAVAYLALANPSVKRTTHRKRRGSSAIRAAITACGSVDDLEAGFRERSILQLSSELTGLIPSVGNSVELLVADESAARRMRSVFESAKRSIWAEFYIIQNDETGRLFLDLLEQKASEGLDVRLLYDAVGSMLINEEKLGRVRRAGGKVESFLPLNPLRKRWSVHLRNHRKLVVVDGEYGFTGGMNVGDEYSGRARRSGREYFHDTHLLIHGAAAGDLAQVFAEDWMFASGEKLGPAPRVSAMSGEGTIVAAVPSGPDQEFNANGMIFFSGIATARERVFLTTPYFVPDGPTARALISAALRGVDVRVMVPAKCDVALVRAAARSYYPELLAGGVRIFEYLPAMLHAKTMVVDGRWGVVGSANVDFRSFRLNFELGAMVVDKKFASLLESRFRADVKDCVEITQADSAKREFMGKLIDGTARLLSPLL